MLLKCLDIDKAKDDGRKIGLTLMGTGFLGIILEKTNVFPGLFLILFGGYLWYLGIAKREENE
ncbi:MAG: hypothetical protein ACKE51_00010 [Methylococcaceae bacterium]